MLLWLVQGAHVLLTGLNLLQVLGVSLSSALVVLWALGSGPLSAVMDPA